MKKELNKKFHTNQRLRGRQDCIDSRTHWQSVRAGLSQSCQVLGLMLVVSTLVVGTSCRARNETPPESRKVGSKPNQSSEKPATDFNVRMEPLSVSGLENVIKINDQALVGGQPKSEKSFQQLAELGIRTIVSVDGVVPDLKLANKFGLKYVHIPIGYDGVDSKASLALASLWKNATGPVYLHCHHGKHRGPAAAAIACLANGMIDRPTAQRLLVAAGTSPDYAGLWKDVDEFDPPSEGSLLNSLPEVAHVDSLAAAMATMDRHFDHLKLCRDNGWKTPSSHPDLVPRQLALLIREGYRESRRTLDSGQSKRLLEWLSEAEEHASQFETSLLQDAAPDVLAKQFETLRQDCRRCHAEFRN